MIRAKRFSLHWSVTHALSFSCVLLCLAACGRVLQPTLSFNVINAPGTSDFTRCEGGIKARFEVRGQTMFESPLVAPPKIYREDVPRPTGTTDSEPVILEATCYGVDGVEAGYTRIETRWQPTVPGMSYIDIAGPVRAGGDTSICVRATETRGEPPCVVSPILR